MFPLLGILGLGLAGAVKPAYDEWAEERRGRRATDALAGAGDDPQAQQRALLAGGLLDPATYAGFGDARQRQEMALGPQWGQLGLDQQRFGLDQQRQRFDENVGVWNMLGQIQDGVPQGIDLMSARDAISGLESGGKYTAVNQDSGALGRYQVMPANVGPWTKQVLGYEMTPDQFLASQDAQDAVFDGIFGGYMEQGGFANAASMWHSGRPLDQAVAAGAHDGNMSTADYVRSVSKAYGRSSFMNNNPVGLEARRRGAPWLDMTPEQRQEIMQEESRLNVMQGSLDYLNETGLAGQIIDPSTAAQMASEWELAVLPSLQSMFDTGAMAEGDLELFKRLIGDGFNLNKFGGVERARMRGVIASMQALHENKLSSYGLNRSGSGFSDMVPYDPSKAGAP